MQKISIWDENSRRIMASERNLRVVMRALDIKAEVQLNSEPPLLARNRINGKTPAVQVNDGDFWTHIIGEVLSVDSLKELFVAMRQKNILE